MLVQDTLGFSFKSDTMRCIGHYLSYVQNIQFFKEPKIRQVNFTTIDDLGTNNDVSIMFPSPDDYKKCQLKIMVMIVVYMCFIA